MDIPNPHHPSQETLRDYSLGKLDDALAEVVHKHLEDCQVCQRRVAEMSPDSFLGRLRDAQEGPQASIAGSAVLGLPPAGSTVNDDAVVDTSASPWMSSTGQIDATSDALSRPYEPSLPSGTRIGYFGDYELLKVLGEGGMGIVYKARQLSLNRLVAVKMIKAARFASPDEVRRFQNESEAVARLDHPNIVPVFEVGQYEDQHYFSMKLIAGESLDKRPKHYLANPRQGAELMAMTADAVHHAHQRGILHRDLKPANILIDSEGRPHITDFGLAKRIDGDSELTQSGAVLGTPAYMAPEQASGRRGAVTTSTDVYGLGAILFAVLTGRAPFGGTSVLETLDQVRERAPESPRKLNPRAPRDLDVICLKCLAKDPRRRYASADALAEDLRRWLAGEPIAARPVGNAARFWMWCRRNPVLAGAVTLVSAALVAVAVLSSLYAGQQTRLAETKTLYADEQKDRASEQAKAAASLKQALSQSNRRLAMFNFERGRSAVENGQVGPGLLWMVKALQSATDAGDLAWKHTALTNLSAWLPHYPRLRAVLSHSGPVRKVAYSPDGRTILTGSTDGTARLWHTTTGQRIGQPMQHPSGIRSFAFSPDGKSVLTACGDKSARLWDATTGSPMGQPLVHTDYVTAVACGPDGKSVVTAGRAAQLWDVATGRPLCQPMEHPGGIWSIAFSPDGMSFLTGGSHDKTARLWGAASGKPIGKPLQGQLSSGLIYVAYSPDGMIALIGDQTEARLWITATSQPIGRPLKHQGVEALAFSPDGKTILTGGVDKAARLWNTATGQLIGRPMAHQGPVRSVVFSPDGNTVLTGSDDGTARLWDAITGHPLGQPLEHQDEVLAVAYSPDGKTVLTGSDDGTARLCDAAIGQLIGKPLVEQGGQDFVAYIPDGKTILTKGSDGTARLWDASTGQPIGRPLKNQTQRVGTVAFSPDGKTILTLSSVKAARLWNTATAEPIGRPMAHQGPVNSVVFSPDGKTVLTGSDDKTARLWDAVSGHPRCQPLEHQAGVHAVAYSPDGKTILTLSGKTARLWDAITGHPLGQPLEHQGLVYAVTYSPDGKTVLTGSDDKTARLWDAVTGHPRGQSLEHQAGVHAVAYSPDGKNILTLSSGKTVRLWDAATGQPIGQIMVHQGSVRSAVFSPNGKTFLTHSGIIDAMAQLWDAATGQPIGQPMQPPDGVWSVAFSPDGKTILTANRNGVRQWNVPALLPDDISRLSALMESITGLELDDQGSIRLLDNAVLRRSRDRFSQLYGPSPESTDRLLDPILFGSDPTARADGLKKLAQWDKAESAYADAERARPRRSEIWAEHGQLYLMRSEPAKAFAAFRESNRLRFDQLLYTEHYMLLLVEAGQMRAYGRARSDMLNRFGKTIDPWTASDVAWYCVLAPAAVSDQEVPVRLAETAVKGLAAEEKHNALKTLGAALYRAGRFVDAIHTLQQGIQLKSGESIPQDWVFLAMSHHRLAHRDEARRWLDRLRSRQPSIDPGQFFEELEIRLLRAEAEAVVLYDPVFPTDPFAH